MDCPLATPIEENNAENPIKTRHSTSVKNIPIKPRNIFILLPLPKSLS